MISQAAARLLRALGLAPKEPPPDDATPLAVLSSPPWTGLHLRSRRPARCTRGYSSPYTLPRSADTPVASRR
jgi:hypothetical protein